MRIILAFKITLTIAFALLFYRQTPGLNIAIFSMLLILGLLLLKRDMHHPVYVYVLFMLAAVSVLIYGNVLAMMGWMLMLLIMSGKVTFTRTYMAAAVMPGGLNLVNALIVNTGRRLLKRQHASAPTILMIAMVMIVAVIFMLLYIDSSAGFSQLVSSINWHIPNLQFWIVLLWGAFISNGIYQHAPKSVLRYLLFPKREQLIGKHIKDPKLWTTSANTLFATLCILTFVVVVSDLVFVLTGTLTNNNPQFYSGIVHEGVGSLVFSMLLALLMLFIFFEGKVNFLDKSTMARNLAYTWIGLNVALLLLTAFKNCLYVNELGMTYKRIGVWYFLVAAAIAMLVALQKIRQDKNLIFVARKAFAAYVTILIISSLVPWELLVTKFNIQQAESRNKVADIHYLMQLDGHNMHLIDAHLSQRIAMRDSNWVYLDQLRWVREEEAKLQEEIHNKDWRSTLLIEHPNKTINR